MKFATSIGLGHYKCNYCAHKAKSGHMKEHVERHMVGLVVQCTLCHGCYGGLGQYRKHFHTGKCRELTQRRDEANNSQSKEQTIGEKYINNGCEEEVSTTVSLKEVHQPIFKASYDKPQPLIRYKNVILTKQDFILEAMTFFTTIGFRQYKCRYCAHKAKNIGHIKEHVETHMVGFGLVVQCSLCHGCYGGFGKYRKHFPTGKCRELTQRRKELKFTQKPFLSKIGN